MLSVQQVEQNARVDRTSPLLGWALLAGGALFFVGGSMHPGEDPPGLSVKEHLALLFSDPAWYPSHALMLLGMVLLASALVALVRSGTLPSVRRLQRVGAVAAAATVLAASGMLLHLVVAWEADALAAGQATPLTNVHVVIETVTVPLFGLSIAALAVIGAWTRSVGNSVTAVMGVFGGIAYGLAGGTFAFTDRLNFLFPFASGIGMWAIASGIGLLLSRVRHRANPIA
jgi:hypothetical protein